MTTFLLAVQHENRHEEILYALEKSLFGAPLISFRLDLQQHANTWTFKDYLCSLRETYTAVPDASPANVVADTPKSAHSSPETKSPEPAVATSQLEPSRSQDVHRHDAHPPKTRTERTNARHRPQDLSRPSPRSDDDYERDIRDAIRHCPVYDGRSSFQHYLDQFESLMCSYRIAKKDSSYCLKKCTKGEARNFMLDLIDAYGLQWPWENFTQTFSEAFH